MADEGSGNRDANVKETVRFWRAWKTVHQLCKDRVCDTNHPSSVLRTFARMLFCSQDRWRSPGRVACDDTMLTAMRLGIRAF